MHFLNFFLLNVSKANPGLLGLDFLLIFISLRLFKLNVKFASEGEI